ncbi:hypothetical protein [Laspinema olomoucense]|uniref:hypothetical protein n=1 Tax=Laspinema olomoucense TaxID=3231600 RepID=UPI0021BB221F|nr:hypothetical protein [Laspinema sp. D3d]MCT7975646.1 hypothetical protein [Laspinema sp. D3d]
MPILMWAIATQTGFFCFNRTVEATGGEKIDLILYPPPDLVIEIDISSPTRFNDYGTLREKELWRFNGIKLAINILPGGNWCRVEPVRISLG